MTTQLELFTPVTTALDNDAAEGWFSGFIPARDGASAFVIMIRGPSDPQPPKKAARHSDRDKTPHLTLRTQSLQQWRERILSLLGDGEARTFNAICVRLAGLTADICGGEVPENALWSLVETGALEFTLEAPVLFRKRGHVV